VEEMNKDTPRGTRILPHLYRVAWWGMLAEGIIDCDTYAIDCGETVVLIDSGRGGDSYARMRENLAHWKPADRPNICLITHVHPDHTGGAVQLRSDGVEVWGGSRASELTTLERVLHDGERLAIGNVAFEAMETPGHTASCMSYFATIDSVRCAFTGDLVMADGQIGYAGSPDFDRARLLRSISRVAGRDFDALLTGHARWMSDGKDRVLECLRKGLDGQWVLDRTPKT